MKTTGNHKKTIILISLIVCCIHLLKCDDPLSGQKNVVKTLLSGTLPAGEYSIYWDGTDDKNHFTGSGQYIALLYTRNFTLIDTLNALEGSADQNNRNEYHWYDSPQLMDFMDNNDPDPFHIQDGTNIRFSLSEEFGVRLTINTL